MKDQKLRPITDEDRVTAIFFGETRNQQEVLDLADYAKRLSHHGEIRNISIGPITAYVVSMMADARHLLIGLDYTLRKGYVFGCVQIPYLEATYRFVMSLAAELNSQLSPLPACCMCGRPVPFPPEVMTTGEDGNPHVSDSVYCSSCIPLIEEKQDPGTADLVEMKRTEAAVELVA